MAPLNYFLHSQGAASSATMLLGWVFAAIAITVCMIIVVLLAYAIGRRRADAAPALEPQEKALRWMAIGTGISTVVLFTMATYSLVVLAEVGDPPGPTALTITVTGYDWWWRLDYGENAGGPGFASANEIHIPVGVPVRLRLDSADVIHAFWVPLLAGKTQMIPGMTNLQWLEADRPGVYRGQCTQYCGVQHAHMALEVVAQSAADYAAWLRHQQQPATFSGVPSSAGRELFMQRCAGCHTVRGTPADGTHGPDLTHLKSRRLIGAGLLTNTPEHLSDWVAHSQAYKPGSRMPDIALTPVDAANLRAFLTTLD